VEVELFIAQFFFGLALAVVIVSIVIRLYLLVRDLIYPPGLPDVPSDDDRDPFESPRSRLADRRRPIAPYSRPSDPLDYPERERQ
jgi:hypothetical protein